MPKSDTAAARHPRLLTVPCVPVQLVVSVPLLESRELAYRGEIVLRAYNVLIASFFLQMPKPFK